MLATLIENIYTYIYQKRKDLLFSVNSLLSDECPTFVAFYSVHERTSRPGIAFSSIDTSPSKNAMCYKKKLFGIKTVIFFYRTVLNFKTKFDRLKLFDILTFSFCDTKLNTFVMIQNYPGNQWNVFTCHHCSPDFQLGLASWKYFLIDLIISETYFVRHYMLWRPIKK